MAAVAMPDPVHLDVPEGATIARWRPLVHWLLAIPHVVVLWALGFVQSVLHVIAFFAVLITGELPASVLDPLVMTHRYQWRVMTYVACLREEYPPFDFTITAADPGDDPARLAIDPPVALQRWLPLVKWLLAIPHVVVLIAVNLAATVAVVVGYVGVIVTGTHPVGVQRFLVGAYRWNLRVVAYAGFMTDRYPPFSLT
jgi:hypothetical protein